MVGPETAFVQLNQGWNAEPNAPEPRVDLDGDDVVLRFGLNGFQFDAFAPGEQGFLRFHVCSRYRFSSVNDEGWYRGQCRFIGVAPKWGEFCEVTDDFKDDAPSIAWTDHAATADSQRNFLFYFRDNAFECSARDWSFDKNQENALLRLLG